MSASLRCIDEGRRGIGRVSEAGRLTSESASPASILNANSESSDPCIDIFMLLVSRTSRVLRCSTSEFNRSVHAAALTLDLNKSFYDEEIVGTCLDYQKIWHRSAGPYYKTGANSNHLKSSIRLITEISARVNAAMNVSNLTTRRAALAYFHEVHARSEDDLISQQQLSSNSTNHISPGHCLCSSLTLQDKTLCHLGTPESRPPSYAAKIATCSSARVLRTPPCGATHRHSLMSGLDLPAEKMG